MKRIRILPILLCIVLIILGISVLYSKDDTDKNGSLIHDVSEELKINDDSLNITYLKGNMLDNELSYGNKITKIIKVQNKTDKLLSYAIAFEEAEFVPSTFLYTISVSDSEDGKYTEITEKETLNNSQVLVYGLGIDTQETQYIKIEFIATKEDKNIIKGILKVKSNLTEKDIFLIDLNVISEAIKNRIEELNGIMTSGYYLLNINDLVLTEEIDLHGFVLIDAIDISQLEYYYSVYSDKYMLRHFLYKDDITKSDLDIIDNEFIKNINTETICKDHTKKECLSFNTLKYNNKGGKKEFLNDLNTIIDLVKNDFNKTDKKVYIYDVKKDISNNTSIRGYILINNVETPEYYLYLTNNLFMVSGYNMTKYGVVDINSTTIRAYNETAFNLSSESMSKVCSFTGFTECFTINNLKV